jgi:hypothetical protein
MLQASYEIGGLAVVVLLIGIWVVRSRRRRKRDTTDAAHTMMEQNLPHRQHDFEHRALIFLMNQKTDAVLAALSRTIEQERQKLGGIVRNPSMAVAIDAFQAEATPPQSMQPSTHDQIQPLAREGMAVDAIARQLRLPEDEVSLLMRLNTA